MGLETKTVIYGIAYHSPLDIVSLLPHDLKVTIDAKEDTDVFFTKEKKTNFKASTQVVFASHRELIRDSIPILDQGDRGQILNLKQIDWNHYLRG